MAFMRPKSLDERIENLRADIDAFIDARVEAIMKECKGVPALAIRNTLVRTGCQCAAYLEMKKRDDEAAAREDAA